MSGFEDPTRPVREPLDVGAVAAWIEAQDVGLRGTPEVRQFPGGASNLTYLLSYPHRDVILRRPPRGHKAKSAHDMVREYRIQSALRNVYPVVPEMIALCEEESVLGADFYVMSRIRGWIPRGVLPEGLALDAGQARAMCLAVLDQMIALHQVDVAEAGLEGLGRGSGYVRRQIDGWTDRMARSKTWNVPGWGPITAWLDEHRPEDVAAVLIHNDFRFDNVVLDPADVSRVVGVLDWEMATIGDPLMDLGNSLAYWVQADDDRVMQSLRRQPTHLPGMLTRRDVVEYYLSRTGHTTTDMTFYVVYGLFRLAVIAQQIYFRYHHRQSRNPAFRWFWLFNHYLRWRAGRALRGVW